MQNAFAHLSVIKIIVESLWSWPLCKGCLCFLPLGLSLSLWVSFLPCLLPCESTASPKQKSMLLSQYAHTVCHFEEYSASVTLTAFVSLQNFLPVISVFSYNFKKRFSHLPGILKIMNLETCFKNVSFKKTAAWKLSLLKTLKISCSDYSSVKINYSTEYSNEATNREYLPEKWPKIIWRSVFLSYLCFAFLFASHLLAKVQGASFFQVPFAKYFPGIILPPIPQSY